MTLIKLLTALFVLLSVSKIMGIMAMGMGSCKDNKTIKLYSMREVIKGVSLSMVGAWSKVWSYFSSESPHERAHTWTFDWQHFAF